MPFKYELQNLSNNHNAIADWLIANPGKGQMGRCAAVFDITPAWLSTLYHQDAFQAMLKHKQGESYKAVIIPLQAKIAGVADAGISKLGEILASSNDERLIHEITRDSLKALGYGANAKAPVVVDQSTHNTLNVDSAALAEARQRRSQRHHGVLLESSSQPPEPSPESQASLIQIDQEPGVGAPRDTRSEHVYSAPQVHGDSKDGGEI